MKNHDKVGPCNDPLCVFAPSPAPHPEPTPDELQRIGKYTIEQVDAAEAKHVAMQKFFADPGRQNGFDAVDALQAYRDAANRTVSAIIAMDRRMMDTVYAERGYIFKPGDIDPKTGSLRTELRTEEKGAN